jgi:hypothetical protein
MPPPAQPSPFLLDHIHRATGVPKAQMCIVVSALLGGRAGSGLGRGRAGSVFRVRARIAPFSERLRPPPVALDVSPRTVVGGLRWGRPSVLDTPHRAHPTCVLDARGVRTGGR